MSAPEPEYVQHLLTEAGYSPPTPNPITPRAIVIIQNILGILSVWGVGQYGVEVVDLPIDRYSMGRRCENLGE